MAFYSGLKRKTGVVDCQIKSLFSIIRKSIYNCLTFRRMQTTKVTWLSETSLKVKYKYYACQNAKLNELLQWLLEIKLLKQGERAPN